MNLILALLPLLASIISIALFRQSALRAGVIGLVLTIAIILAWSDFQLDLETSVMSVSSGLFSTLNISYILLGGVFLYRVLERGGALKAIANSLINAIDDPVHRLLALVFGLSVFFESATGFGVGIVVVAPLYIALGYKPMQAAVLALLGQCAVPWGALSVGTVIGADISNVTEVRLGVLSAIFTLPLCLLFGVAALRTSGLLTFRSVRMLCLYAALLSGSLCLSSAVIGVELAGCLAGLIVVVAAMCVCSRSDRKSDNKDSTSFAIAVLPFSVLLVALFITRLVPAIRDSLQQNSITILSQDFAPLYHAGFYLLCAAVVGLLVLPQARNKPGVLFSTVVGQWWLATLAIGGFILFGQLMLDSGMTQELSVGIARAASDYYAFAVPVIGAIGGILTASNAASNAIFMALQVSVAGQLGLPVDAVAAGQNASGSNVTLASPGRLVFAASVVGQPGAESSLLGRVAPVTIAGVISASLLTALLCRYL